MSIGSEIDSAIAAHGQWKAKLRAAIDTGTCESTPDRVKADHNCSFGKWLHGRVDVTLKSSQYYKDIVKLHAEFHREAGTILELALNGDKEQAAARMGMGSLFRRTSSALTSSLNEWKTSVG